MKRIKLTKGKIALVDDEDFEFINQWKWYATKGKASYYARRTCCKNGKQGSVAMHRIILGLTDPKIMVDHKDHNGLNNQRSNIRLCSYSQNSSNVRKQKYCSSQYLGVNLEKSKKWRARISVQRNDKYLGVYDSEHDAAIAYNKAAIRLHGEFASLNIINK